MKKLEVIFAWFAEPSTGPMLTRWGIFTLLIPLLPIASAAALIRLGGTAPDISQIVGRGELVLIATGLCALAVSDALVSGQRMLVPKLLLGGGSLAMVSFTSQFYAQIQSTAIAQLDVAWVAWMSLQLYGASVLISFSGLLIADSQ